MYALGDVSTVSQVRCLMTLLSQLEGMYYMKDAHF